MKRIPKRTTGYVAVMPWPFVAPPDKIYAVSLDGPALQARVLQESTRLRDAFPTRSFFSSARPLMIVPYSDGFDLIHFPISQHPYAWLSVKVEVLGSRCRLHVSRRRRPRPERIVFVVFPPMIALMIFSATVSGTLPPAVPFVMVVPFVVIVGVMNYQERRQERRLLELLGAMFPGITDETATRI